MSKWWIDPKGRVIPVYGEHNDIVSSVGVTTDRAIDLGWVRVTSGNNYVYFDVNRWDHTVKDKVFDFIKSNFRDANDEEKSVEVFTGRNLAWYGVVFDTLNGNIYDSVQVKLPLAESIGPLPFGPSWLNARTGEIVKVVDSHPATVAEIPNKLGLSSSQIIAAGGELKLRKLAYSNGWLRVVRYRNGKNVSFEGIYTRSAVDAITEIAASLRPDQRFNVEWVDRREFRDPTAEEIVADSSVLESTDSLFNLIESLLAEAPGTRALLEGAEEAWRYKSAWINSKTGQVLDTSKLEHWEVVAVNRLTFDVKYTDKPNTYMARALRAGWIRYYLAYGNLHFEGIHNSDFDDTILEICMAAVRSNRVNREKEVHIDYYKGGSYKFNKDITFDDVTATVGEIVDGKLLYSRRGDW